MTASIVNAAPMTVMLGTQDKSTRPQVADPEVLPSHLAKVYGYAQKGPEDPQLVAGVSRTTMYGEASFDLRQPWATHATVLSNTLNAKGNAQMFQRVRPVDARVATLRLSLDVLSTLVDDYQRNSDGSIATNSSGVPIALSPKIPGYKVKWVVEEILPNSQGVDQFGLGTQKPGNQTDSATSSQSIRYPIIDLAVSSFGAYGKNVGLRLWAPTTATSSPVDERVLSNEKVYPFRMACVARADELSTPKVTATLAAEQFVNVCFKPDVINRVTDSELSIHQVFLQAYQDLNNPNFAPVFGPFGKLHVYDAQLSTLLGLFYAAEHAYIDGFSDFLGTTAAEEKYLFNLVSGVSSQNVPYHSFQIVSGTSDSARLSESSSLFALGGSDGTMSEALFAGLVADLVTEYADENSPLQDTAKYPESIMYDSGFPLATKYAMCSFIAARKDTAVVLATHDVLGPQLSASEESALAIALRTRLQNYPESEFFGTTTMRGMIVGRSGKLMNSQYRKYLPLTIEIASKSAGYMGAGDGKWKATENFDRGELNEVTLFQDINVTFTPARVRNKDWAAGLVWVESYSRRSYYFPALKTVYDNDTSILNSFFTMMCAVELEKVGDRMRRKYSGDSSLTNEQLVARVNEDVITAVQGRFDNRFVIVPVTTFSAPDLQRGFSWTLAIQIYAPNMKTVMTLSIEAYRISDLAT